MREQGVSKERAKLTYARIALGFLIVNPYTDK